MNAEKRLEYISELLTFHPAIVQQANLKCARYVGGFVDDGDLNYKWVLFEATLPELAQCIEDCKSIKEKQFKNSLQSSDLRSFREELDAEIMKQLLDNAIYDK